MDPNFPENLNIAPSAPPAHHGLSGRFDASMQRDAIEKFGIAGRVWEAAYAMNLYIESPSNWEFDPPFLPPSVSKPLTFLELGSGTGITSVAIVNALEKYPGNHRVIMTDLPEVCPQLEDTAQLHNGTRNLITRPLTWGHISDVDALNLSLDRESRVLTHIICSDLVYFPFLLAPLLRTLLALTAPHDHSPTPTVVISYKIRSLAKETTFWQAFGLWFEYAPVLARSSAGGDDDTRWARWGADGDDGPTFVFVARRRVESAAWTVPGRDEELLAGVGAWGTGVRKEDGTFEMLLLMGFGSDDDDS